MSLVFDSLELILPDLCEALLVLFSSLFFGAEHDEIMLKIKEQIIIFFIIFYIKNVKLGETNVVNLFDD